MATRPPELTPLSIHPNSIKYDELPKLDSDSGKRLKTALQVSSCKLQELRIEKVHDRQQIGDIKIQNNPIKTIKTNNQHKLRYCSMMLKVKNVLVDSIKQEHPIAF